MCDDEDEMGDGVCFDAVQFVNDRGEKIAGGKDGECEKCP